MKVRGKGFVTIRDVMGGNGALELELDEPTIISVLLELSDQI